MKNIEEIKLHPERFDVLHLRREDGLDDICVVRKSTGETVAQNLANALVQIDEHAECFDLVHDTDKNNMPVIRVIRKLTGEVAANRYSFSKNTG